MLNSMKERFTSYKTITQLFLVKILNLESSLDKLISSNIDMKFFSKTLKNKYKALNQNMKKSLWSLKMV